MEDKIFDIITDLLREDISKTEAIDKLLILHSDRISRNKACCHSKSKWIKDSSGDYFCLVCEGEVEA